MSINKVNFSAGSEDLSDIYVSQLEVQDRLADGTLSQDLVRDQVVDLLLGGQLWSWGESANGILGDGATLDRSSPVQVGSIVDWRHIASYTAHNAAIKQDNSLWIWGSAANGRLGLNSTVTFVSVPTRVGALSDWKWVSVGFDFTVAIKTTGSLWSWGEGNTGRHGGNTTVDRSSPVQIGALTDWRYVNCGNSHSLAVKTDGSMWSWGLGTFGRLGTNGTVNRSSPVRITTTNDWSAVAAGTFHSAAIKTDGSLWTWGEAVAGALGLSAVTDRSSPTQVGTGADWYEVAVAGYTSIAIKKDLSLWSWGEGDRGQRGSNSTVDSSSPVQVGTLTDWHHVNMAFLDVVGQADRVFAASTKTDGTLWVWGDALVGKLGLNGTIDRSSPTQVGTQDTWKQIACAGEHTLARKSVS